MFYEITGAILFCVMAIALYKKIKSNLEKKKIKKDEYNIALNELRLMQSFVEDSERIKRWKLIQGKCQFFASAYKNDKNSKLPEISDEVDEKLEKWIKSRIDEAFAIDDDEYCQAASFDAIAEFMATVGQFERAQKVIDLITVQIIKENAIKKYKQLSIRNFSSP